MTTCPKCQNPISDEFGLVTCSQCQSSVFVDIEGNVRLAEDVGQAQSFAGQSDSLIGGEDYDEGVDIPEEEIPPGEGEWVEQNSMVQPYPDLSSSPEEGDYSQAPQADLSLDESSTGSTEVFSEPSEEMPDRGGYELEPLPEASSEESMAEVNQFGNSELSSATEGSIKYKVWISGIDDPDLRQEVQEVLQDRRFMWSVEELMASIKSGRLVLSGVNPVKASVLINRLKPVSVHVKWEQYVLQVSSTDSSTDHRSVDELDA